jgi:NAD-dependent dihydropyrimidine dehydrogenase PreA subunit/flavodoxin
METILFYFTGTGNSLKAAKDLAEKLGSAELRPIVRSTRKGDESIPVSADRIGIICPVYAWGLPLIVQQFIQRLVLKKSAYIFGLVTYGGFPAATLKQINHLLKEKGSGLSAGFGVQLPGNYTPMYGAFPEEKQKKLFSNAEIKLEQMAGIIREGRTAKIESNSFFVNLVFTDFIHKNGIPQFSQGDREFWVTEKCTGCSTCANVCPVDNIKLEEGKPKWQHHCQRCLACLHWCPEEAIELGKWTPGRKRYRHPKITVEDIIQQK